jgi:ATP-dependent Clp protease protease subunit
MDQMNKETQNQNQARNSKRNEDFFIGNPLISAHGDHIYFYAPVSPESALELNQKLHQASMQNLAGVFNSMYEVNSPPPIWLHINSYGGELFSAFAIADTIERIKTTVPVVTIVEGCAASAATVISTAGTRRLMRKNAYMLIHELSDSSWGRFTELQDNYKSNEDIMKTMKEWYLERTKIKPDKLDEILKHDIWWNSALCRKNGLVDDII